tara:strand:+ start:745 stop:915 length:171 start_codon:yes stop_codon:yes gene_type:complete
MKITFGMPEILVILSIISYPQSAILSVLFFLMGIFGRLLAYGIENKRLEDEKSLEE